MTTFSYTLNKSQITPYISAIARAAKAAAKLPAMGANRDSCLQLSMYPGTGENDPAALLIGAHQSGRHACSLRVEVESITDGYVLIGAAELVELSKQANGKPALTVSLAGGSRLLYEVTLNSGGRGQAYGNLHREQRLFEPTILTGHGNGFAPLIGADRYLSYILPKLAVDRTCGRYKFLLMSAEGDELRLFGTHTEGGYVEYRIPTGSPVSPFDCTLPLEGIRALDLKEGTEYDVAYSEAVSDGALRLINGQSRLTVLGVNKPIKSEYERYRQHLELAPTGSLTLSFAELEEHLRFLSYKADKGGTELTLEQKGPTLEVSCANSALGIQELTIETQEGVFTPIRVDLKVLQASLSLLGRLLGKPNELLPVIHVVCSTREFNVGPLTIRSLTLENENDRDVQTRILIMERITR